MPAARSRNRRSELRSVEPEGDPAEASEIIWEEPPTLVRGGNSGRAANAEHIAFAASLRDYPDSWAVFRVCEKPKTAHSLVQQIKNGRTAAFRPKGAFESVTRPAGDGSGAYKVYVRFIGDPEEAEENPE